MLADFLAAETFGFLLVLTRMGALFMTAPAFGEQQVPARVRLGLALATSFLIYLNLSDALPALPAGLGAFVGLILVELTVGLMIALAMRILFSALNVAGTVVAFQTSLAFSQQFDPTQGTQSAITANLMSMLGILLIFTSNLHLVMLGAMVDSYAKFPTGALPAVGDMASLITDYVAASFLLGMQIAAPFLVFGIVFNIGLGFVARLMPQLPVFFVALPLNIGIGFVLLLITLPAMMMWFLGVFGDRVMLLAR